MAWPETIGVKDANNVEREIPTPNANGRAPAADSRPTAWSDEDLAVAQAIRDRLGTVTDTDIANLLELIRAAVAGTLTVSGTVGIDPEDNEVSIDGLDLSRASTGTAVPVASATVDTLLLAANPLRKGYSICNDSTEILYVLTADGEASTSLFSFKLGPNDTAFDTEYTGEVRGIWAGENGQALVTELS